MKSTKRRRWVKFHTLTMRALPDHEFTAALDLRNILECARQRLARGEILQRSPTQEARTHVRLLDVTFTADQSHAILLFRLIDRDGQDASYENIEDGAVETHPKHPTQGNRAVGHFAINLSPAVTAAGKQYKAALEVVSGISAGLVRDRLNSVGSRCGVGAGSLDGGRTSVAFRANFTVNAFAQGTIGQLLEKGDLEGFTLEHSYDKQQGIDETGLTQARRRRVELDVVSTWRDRVADVFAAAQGRALREGYEVVKVHYESEEGQSATHSISATKVDALEDVVAKVDVIVLQKDMHNDLIVVCPEMAEQMVERL